MKRKPLVLGVAFIIITGAVLWVLARPGTALHSIHPEAHAGLHPEIQLESSFKKNSQAERLISDLPDSSPGSDDYLAYTSRLQRYCHRSLLTTHQGTEGAISSSTRTNTKLELVQVHMIARHGDRAPAYPGSLGPPVDCRCGLEGNKERVWEGLKDFPLPHIALNVVDRRAKYLSLFPGSEERPCGVGMLTRDGFRQHHALGRLMRDKYSTLIGESFNTKAVFVHTTDLPRTIQSAGAFLLGFLPDNATLRRETHIHISRDIFLGGPPPGITVTHGPCRNYGKLWSQDCRDTGYFATEKTEIHHLVEKLCDMFGIQKDRDNPIITRLFDYILTRGCHDNEHPLPCNRNGVCVDYGLARKLFVVADWTFSHKYPHNSSSIVMLPFLKQSVLAGMEKAIQGTESTVKFMLSFAHDSTLSQILSALGDLPHEWLPYASRLIFELWRDSQPSEPLYYVRVLIDGEPVTSKFPFSQHASSFEEDNDLILFSSWRHHLQHYVARKYIDSAAYNAICENKI